MADLSGRPELSRTARCTAGGGVLSPVVSLVHDLGRPARFLRMVRLVESTSSLSVGTYILSPFSAATAATAGGGAAGLISAVGAVPRHRRALFGGPMATRRSRRGGWRSSSWPQSVVGGQRQHRRGALSRGSGRNADAGGAGRAPPQVSGWRSSEGGDHGRGRCVKKASRGRSASHPVRRLRRRHGQRQGPEVHRHPAPRAHDRPEERARFHPHPLAAEPAGGQGGRDAPCGGLTTRPGAVPQERVSAPRPGRPPAARTR
jgi:hypothetical protein